MKKEDTIGGRLKKARLKMGLTLNDAHKDLKIYPRTLKALEEDRIDPAIGDIYIKSFLRKYASYLGFEADKILSEFSEAPLLKEPERTQEAQEESFIDIGKDRIPPLITKEKIKKAILSLAVLSALLLTVSIISFAASWLTAEFKRLPAVFSKASTSKVQNDVKKPPSFVPIGEPLRLKVETKDEVWMRVKSDGKVIFVQTLPKGSTETWNADSKLELWVGRADALNLTLNGKHLGSPGRGLIKEIIIDHNGLRIGKK